MNIRPLVASLLVATIVCTVVSQVRAENFLLQTGETIEGIVVRSAGKTLSIKMPERGMRQLPISEIDHVELTLRSGEQIIGELIGWSNREYKVLVADRLLSVKGGKLILDLAAETQSTEQIGQVEDVGSHRTSLPKPESEQSAEGDPRVEPVKVEVSLPKLTGSSTPIEEDAGVAIIHLELSKATSKPVAVIYSVIGRAAKNGTDYHDSAGVAIIESGKMGIDVSVPIINDDLAEPDEEFELFLTVDPKVASFEGRKIVTIIRDDDS